LEKKELIENAKKKDSGFNLYWFVIAMEKIKTFSSQLLETYYLISSCTIEEIKEFYNKWIEEIRKEIIEEIER